MKHTSSLIASALLALTLLALTLFAPPAGAQVSDLSGTLVVTNKTPSTATIIDVGSGRTVATLPTGAGPHEIALSSTGRIAVVTDYSGQPGRTLTVIGVPLQRVIHTIDLGQYNRPHGIVFLPGDSLVAVTSEASRNLLIVNVLGAGGGVRSAIATEGQNSHMVGVTSDASRAYTGNIGSNTVSEIDLRSGKFTRSWNVPEQPEAINVTPDGKEVWVGSNATGVVSVIDVATGAITTVAEGLGWPYRVLYTPDMRSALIPDLRGEELRFIDRATKRELGRIPFKGAGPQGIAITPDGRYAFQSLSTEARVAIVDVERRKVVGYLAAGETPDGVAYTPLSFQAPPTWGGPAARPADVQSLDAIIAATYDVISGPAGQKRDWDRFLSLFVPGARLIPSGRRPFDSAQVLRVMSPDEYAAQSGPALQANGFYEREIGRTTERFGGIVHAFSAYESKRTPDARPFARGINSFQLMHDGRRWWIVSIFWEAERSDNRIPAKYLARP